MMSRGIGVGIDYLPQNLPVKIVNGKNIANSFNNVVLGNVTDRRIKNVHKRISNS
jgi:hypothetical protein